MTGTVQREGKIRGFNKQPYVAQCHLQVPAFRAVCSLCGQMGLYSHLVLSLCLCLPASLLFLPISPVLTPPYFLFPLLSLPSVQAPWCHSPCGCCMPSFPNTWPRPKRLWTACTVSDLCALLLVHTSIIGHDKY